ncbi:MAG: PHP domain-containing protein, partial [bacterium]
MESAGFVHLHTHSHFSPTGLASPRQLVERAARLGMKALALTDHNSLAGFFPFLDACETNGIKPIIGCELSILPFDARRYQNRIHHLTLLAETERGYRNLCRLVSLAHHEGGPSNPYLRFDQFSEHCSELIALTGCARSELFTLLADKKPTETEKYLTRLANVVGVSNIYFEVQDRGHPLQKEVNANLLELAEFLEFPTVVTHNVHYLDPLDAIAQACLRPLPRDDPSILSAWEEGRRVAHFATASEMEQRVAHVPEALANTARIAERCDGALIPKGDLYPVLTFPRGEDARSFLWRESFEAAPRRFGQLDEGLKKQINEGYDDIIREGLAAHLVFLFRVAHHLDAKGLPRGPGRGHLITNPVSYVLGLSQIDPKLYPFVRQPWRAVGERYPLLELEVPERASETVRQYLRDTYGPSSVAEIGLFSSRSRKSLFREIAAWAGLTEAEADSLYDEIPAKSEPISAREEVRVLPPDQRRAQNPKVLAFILALLQSRPVGPQHGSARFVVSAGPLDDIVALTYSEPSSAALTQCDDEALDRLGLPRLQLLHPPLLETLDQILHWASADQLEPLRLDLLPLDENSVFDLLNQGKTNGIEPFWSITMKAILRDANPRSLPQLVKCYADAHRRRRRAATGDLLDHVPRCLMGYWVAYFKALYPVSFCATLLSRTYEHHRAFPVLLREALAQEIAIRPPDINDS